MAKDSVEREVELAVESVTDGAMLMIGPDGRILSWNAGAQRMTGYSARDIIGRPFTDLFLLDDRTPHLSREALERAGSEGHLEAEEWGIRKDNSRFRAHVVLDPADAEDCSFAGFAMLVQDVTEQQSGWQPAHDRELQFRMFVRGVRDYAIYMLDTEGLITSWNAGAQAIKGYEERDIVGKHFSLFYTDEDRTRGAPEAALAAALQDGKFEAEAVRVRKDGSEFWAHVVIDPIYNDAGEHVGFAKITRDITEKRRAEDELREAQQELMQSQKLQALGELAGGIAHDFNNLMTVVRGSADFLLREPDLPPQKRTNYLHAMLETAERATDLTSQLLAFARRQPLEPEVIDLSVRMDAIGEMLQRTLGARYDLRLDLAPALWHVEIDPTGLETALLNGVLNARDAMPEGGCITISTRNVAQEDGDTVSLAISDTGEGIAPEEIDRVFEPFFTTKPTGKGTGLGLSQIHGFAVQSGGSARIESQPGRGTTLEIQFPRSTKQLSKQARNLADIAIPSGLKVLVVEDSDHVRYFAHQLLEDLGCEVIEAPNGVEALRLLEESCVDIVFSDIVMPGMSGLELAKEIRARNGNLPVLLASGYSSKQFIPKDQREFPILRKPYTLQTLAAGISDLKRADKNDVQQG